MVCVGGGKSATDQLQICWWRCELLLAIAVSFSEDDPGKPCARRLSDASSGVCTRSCRRRLVSGQRLETCDEHRQQGYHLQSDDAFYATVQRWAGIQACSALKPANSSATFETKACH